MDILNSLILGLVQGLTEFIPVSSSGHLVIFGQIFHMEESGILFDAFLHLGTLLAVIIYFWRQWVKVLRGLAMLIGSIFKPALRQKEKEGQKLLLYLVIGTIPAMIAGLAFRDSFTGLFQNLFVVGVSFLVVGVVLVAVEKVSYYRRQKDGGNPARSFKQLKFRDALYAGLAQAAALVPGISRSGMTIAAGMASGLRRRASARFSFLLSAPVILGAGLVSFQEMLAQDGNSTTSLDLIVGFTAAAVSGYFAIKYLLRFLHKRSLVYFAVYLFIVGTLLVIFYH